MMAAPAKLAAGDAGASACILVEDGPDGAPALFPAPREIVRADSADEVPDALGRLDAALKAGAWIAGALAYELGYALEPRLAPLMPARRRRPLIHMAVTEAPGPAAETLEAAAREAGGAALSPPAALWSREEYGRAAREVLRLIAAGDIYQANLTFPLRARWEGTPLGLYGALRAVQPVPHGALVVLPGAPAILSRSPELFFRTAAGGAIETRPMKGTAPRDPDPRRDAALARALGESVKNRAENLMIVDLLRNDISRICATGSVKVPDLFAVQTFATVHQMISRVTGQLLPGTGFGEIVRALFPCGSVTGAPKIRAMEIIRALEPEPRGAYCGAVGWMAPDGRAAFNVAIRTLELDAGGAATLSVGGGVVHDSTPDGEYEEALWKARFAHLPFRPERG